MQSKSFTVPHQIDETSWQMTCEDKMQLEKRRSHQKWPLPCEKQLIDTAQKMWKRLIILERSCTWQKDCWKDTKACIRTCVLFWTRCESSYSASTWKMTLIEIFHKTSNISKFWQQLRSTLPPSHQLQTHVCGSPYDLEYKNMVGAIRGWNGAPRILKVVSLDSRPRERQLRRCFAWNY